MAELLYTQWRNNNERVNYPFADTVTLQSKDGLFIPQDTFDDARFYVIGGGPDLYLSNIKNSLSTVTLYFSDSTGQKASASYDIGSPPDNLEVLDGYGRPAGIMVSSAARLIFLASVFPPGDNVFEEDAATFAASVVTPMPQYGVTGVVLDDGALLTGEVWLVGTDGIVLSMDGSAIRVDIVGDPYASRKACEEEGIPLDPFCGIKTINDIGPDENGDFKLTVGANAAVDPVIRIEQNPNINPVIKTLATDVGGCGA